MKNYKMGSYIFVPRNIYFDNIINDVLFYFNYIYKPEPINTQFLPIHVFDLSKMEIDFPLLASQKYFRNNKTFTIHITTEKVYILDVRFRILVFQLKQIYKTTTRKQSLCFYYKLNNYTK